MRAARLACPLIALMVSTPGAHAQTTYPSPYGASAYPSPYMVQPLTNADLLANEIRALAANPLDLNALVRAGELAVKIGDTTAAATFFARAERIDPRNARVKAGEGSLLVSAERPGEALRRFAEAESLGGDARTFAADRGLAYDLIGEQDRAQREYRVALRAGANDETQRRYALSLGISGKRELALAQIDPLLRKSDRGAWRVRAFILAMAGDQTGAERIAASMMPGGLGQGLQPFFALLTTLRPADRAFAVHFGEVRTTPERQFDARLVPPLATLGPDPTAPVLLAAVVKPAAPVKESRRDRKRREVRERNRVAVAAVNPPPVPTAVPAPTPIASIPVAVQAVPVQAAPAFVAPAFVAPAFVAPAFVAQAWPVATATPMPTPAYAPAPTLALVPEPAPAPAPAPTPEPAPAPPVAAPIAPVTVAAAPVPAPQPAAPVVTAPVVNAQVVPVSPAPAVATASLPAPVRSEESILASILADIKVPAAELEGSAIEPATEPPPRVVAKVETAPAGDRAEADRKAEEKKAADKKAADKKAADKKIADKKLADAKVLADKKAAEDKKKRDPKLLEPARIWVQVAGGATESDLPREWARVRGKAAAAFKGRSGWTTPLRATNRVLTGPFKSESEAQAFVNTVAKDGISGFVFTSEAGQKIDKLPAK